MTFLRFIRFPNLLMVILIQEMLYWRILWPIFKDLDLSPRLTPIFFHLYVFVTVLLTTGGYIINDIIDLPIDRINRPRRVLVQQMISLQVAQWLYALVSISGFLIALYLAFLVHQVPLVNLYWLALLLLLVYSVWLKRLPLVGNLLVALLCAGVALAVWLAEWPTLQQVGRWAPAQATAANAILAWYAGFAFLSTLYREIVKDLEDQDGDSSGGALTLPLAIGERGAKGLASMVALLLVGSFAAQAMLAGPHFGLFFFGAAALLVGLPTLWSIVALWRAHEPEQYHRVSLLCKWIMLSGILLLFFLP